MKAEITDQMKVNMKIVFFDGYCTLCNVLVDWLIKVDRNGKLKFASLQGETARKLLNGTELVIDIDTVIYLREGKKHERSTAILQTLSDVGGLWSLTKIFFIIPKSVRDLIYNLIAKNRYRFLKKRDSCRIPTQEEKNRLLP